MKYFLLLQVRKLFKRCAQKTAASVLVELLVTIAIVAFLCVLSIGGLKLTRHHAVAAQAQALRATCWYLQQRARAIGQEQSLTFDEAHRLYVTSTGEVYRLLQDVHFGIIPGASGSPADPRAPLARAITFAHNKIIFHSTGVVQPGAVYLVDKDKQILYAVTVAVSGVSYVRLYRYDHLQWQLCV